jgi:hypothetical protein
MGEEKIVHKIEKIEKVDTSKKVDLSALENKEAIQTSKTKFDEAIAKAEINWSKVQPQKTEIAAATESKVTRPSPIDELSMSQKKIQRLEPVSEAKVAENAEALQGRIATQIQALQNTQAQNPNIKLSPVDANALSEKLVHIDATLNSALGIAGGEVKALPATPTATSNPMMTFLNYLTHGDRALAGIVGEVRSINLDKNELTPARLLAIQIKLNFVQQELEFFTTVLNKAIDSTKTLLQVQI